MIGFVSLSSRLKFCFRSFVFDYFFQDQFLKTNYKVSELTAHEVYNKEINVNMAAL